MISNIKRIQLPCSIKRFDCGMGSNPDLKRLRYIYFVFGTLQTIVYRMKSKRRTIDIVSYSFSSAKYRRYKLVIFLDIIDKQVGV